MKMYRDVIDKDKARKGFESFVTLADDEKLILFCDDTIMGSGKEGAALTDRRIVRFEKTDQTEYVLAETRDVEPLVLSGEKASGLKITDGKGEISEILLAGIDSDDLEAFIEKARSRIGGEGGTREEKTEETPPEEVPAEKEEKKQEPVALVPQGKKRCTHEAKGERCQNKAIPGKDNCFEHLSAEDREAYLEQLKKRLEHGEGLSGEFLANVDCATLPLKGADLSGADLSGAQLKDMDLAGTNFTGANLEKAKFHKANLTGAIFAEAQMHKANLRSCTIDGTVFEASKGIDTAAFNGSYLGDTSGIPSDLKSGIEASADRLDLWSTFQMFLLVFGGIGALLNIVAAFIFVAIPMGFKGIVVFVIVGWMLAGAAGVLMGGALGAVVGIVPSFIIATTTKGKKSPHAAG